MSNILAEGGLAVQNQFSYLILNHGAVAEFLYDHDRGVNQGSLHFLDAHATLLPGLCCHRALFM